MDINNSLIPAEFAENYTKVSKWSRPGGTLAKVLTVIAGCAGVFALYKALPFILSMMTNAFSIACLAIGLYALVSIVSNKKFRRMISTCFFLLCSKISQLAIETDPIAIIRRHTYNINAMATQISRDFYIQENPAEDKSYVLVDEMRLFAMDMKSRVTFISRVKN